MLAPDLRDRRPRGAADALRGRVVGDQLGVRQLERTQLFHELVEGRVAHDRVVEHVVAVFVGFDLANQLGVADLRRHGGGSHFRAAGARFQW